MSDSKLIFLISTILCCCGVINVPFPADILIWLGAFVITNFMVAWIGYFLDV